MLDITSPVQIDWQPPEIIQTLRRSLLSAGLEKHIIFGEGLAALYKGEEGEFYFEVRLLLIYALLGI